MASLIKPCAESSTRVKLYRFLLQPLYFLGLRGSFSVSVAFSGEELRFVLPLHHLNAVLNNMEHVLVSCDYYQFKPGIPGPGDIVVDAGAYVGFYTVASAVLTGRRGFVHAVEPNPEAVEYLAKNIEANNLIGKARCFPIALCPTKGTAKLYIGEYSSVSSLIRNHVENYTAVARVEEVKCVKLSTLLKYVGSADVLKLDVEGLEYELIREAGNELKRVSRIVVEAHEPETSLDDIETLLLSLGFKRIIIYASHENPTQTILYAYK
ncbi:MAG: FkbM family methyltransferase [Desulfurococcaceae archaeon]